ncbi:MAG: PAS domain S-box protein [Syntrophus sp. (in: bacteria)]
MSDHARTNLELIEENALLKQRIQELEQSESGRKQAEEALRKSVEEHRLIIENSHDIIYTITPEGVFTFVSPSWTTLLGHPITQVVGKPFQLFVHPDDIVGCLAFLQESFETGQRQTGVEYRVQHADGSWRWHTTNSVPLRDEAGKIVGFEGSASDITDRKRAEEIIKRSEEKFSKAFHSSPILTAISTIEDGRFLDVNEIFIQTLLFSREEVIGKTSLELGFFTNSLQRQALKKITEENGYAKNMETQMVAKDGRIINGLFSAEPITINNEKCWLTVMVDVTEQKRVEEALRDSEEKYRNLFENANDAIFVAQDGKLVFLNPMTTISTGYSSEELMARPFIEFIHSDDRGMVIDRHVRRTKGEKISHRYPFRIIHRDGNIRWADLNAVLINWNGKTATLNFMSDITERKQTEDEKRSLEGRLRYADKMESIGTLAGGIAHDFNNLLMGIQGYASLSLMNIDPSHPNYERIRRIEDQVQSGADLTRQLLGFARGGRYEVKPADMNDILEKSSSMFGRTKKEISIHRKYGKDLWTVDVDQGQMEQVFMNLYVNAWQAMPGGGEIYLETENIILDDERAVPYAVKPGRYIKISVTDNGTGMDEKTKERIFDPFFTTKEMGRGTGLGLATVYGIIKGHGGMINVDSEPGHGTMFTIYLPASEKEVTQEKTTTGIIAKGTETILLVDDEKMVLEVSKELLESMGYRVYAVGSGQEAIAIFMEKRNEIDMVILDMIMPGISGGGTFDRLREINPEIKVLLSSGYSLNGEAATIMDRGCNGFLQKPFKMENLSLKVREMLG